MLSTSEALLVPVWPDLSSSKTAELTSTELMLVALKQAYGDHYKAPEIVTFPISGATVLDAMAVTGNF
jgi:hypothetical protein